MNALMVQTPVINSKLIIMRTQNIFLFIVLLCLCFTLSSCSEDLTETNKGYDVLTLTADKEVINLNEKMMQL